MDTLGQKTWKQAMKEANDRARETGKRQMVKHDYRHYAPRNRIYAYYVVNEAFLPGGRFYDPERFKRSGRPYLHWQRFRR